LIVAKKYTYQSGSPEETINLGRSLGRTLEGGETIALVGQLGAGKTQLVKGIAMGNGLDDPRQVTSPTFVLVKEYPGRVRLYHLDFYRLHGDDEVMALGFDEMTSAGSAAVIEWADRAPGVMPQETLWVMMSVIGPSDRSITFRPKGDKAVRALRDLVAAFR